MCGSSVHVHSAQPLVHSQLAHVGAARTGSPFSFGGSPWMEAQGVRRAGGTGLEAQGVRRGTRLHTHGVRPARGTRIHAYGVRRASIPCWRPTGKKTPSETSWQEDPAADRLLVWESIRHRRKPLPQPLADRELLATSSWSPQAPVGVSVTSMHEVLRRHLRG